MTPPITSSQVPDQWIADVHQARADYGHPALRPHPTLPRIQVFSPNTGQWHDLMLPGSGFDFVSGAERDLVVGRLVD